LQHLYHDVPAELIGSTLYPLNDLRESHPDIHAREIATYDDHPSRITLPRTTIDALDCLWNHVLHASPIQPNLLSV
jgi:hypothetical protein